MAKINAKDISKLREATGAPVMRVKKVLDEQDGDYKKAEAILKKEGFAKAAKRADRETGQGVIDTYVHHSKKVASMVELLCETDFVAKNDLFQDLAHELALQVASFGAENADDLLKQDYVKDPKKKIEDLLKETIAKTGENIRVGRVIRVELGKDNG